MSMTIKLETVGSVKSRQSVWVDWMEDATQELGDSDLVETTTDATPWGNYLMKIQPARKCEGECGQYLVRAEFSEDPSHEVCDVDFAEYTAYLDSLVAP